MTARRPAVAGLFYPGDPDGIERALAAAFADAVAPEPSAPVPKALVVPHAGWIYSGAIAASAYGRVAAASGKIQRVVLLGPSHRVYVPGIAVPAADAFDTPLGTVTVDVALRDAIADLPDVRVDDEPHRNEHSLEVQLPFLQHLLGEFSLLPLAVGDATDDQVAAVLDATWGGTETLVVVSTDLSHYQAYATARRLDARTAAAIVARDGDAIRDRDACGARPLRGLLVVARRLSLAVEQLDLRNSGDTAGDRDRVVGYGSFAVG